MSLILDGTSGVTFPNSTVQASAGQVLQVVNATYSTQVSTSSTSFSTTNLTASITPKFSTSKIIIIVSIVSYTGASNRGIRFQITRGATDIYNSPVYSAYSGNSNMVSTSGISLVDSPATTSSTTYTLNFATPEAGLVYAQYNNAPSTITLMEIAG